MGQKKRGGRGAGGGKALRNEKRTENFSDIYSRPILRHSSVDSGEPMNGREKFTKWIERKNEIKHLCMYKLEPEAQPQPKGQRPKAKEV